MSFVIRRFELEGSAVVAVSSALKPHNELWRAQNEAERLARMHARFRFDQERACWQGSDADGRTFRYIAERQP
jgi:hypothetical protein